MIITIKERSGPTTEVLPAPIIICWTEDFGIGPLTQLIKSRH